MALDRPFENMESSQLPTNDELEKSAATELGYILFEYSRLDMELGLLLVWAENGQSPSVLTKKLNDLNFNGRLKLLEKLARKKYQGMPAEVLYASWLTKAHAIRTMRNQFFHGRWGMIPDQRLVANVIGIPTSVDQSETRYSIEQLHDSMLAVKELRAELMNLREKWPI